MNRFTTRFSPFFWLFLSTFGSSMAQSPTPVAANGQLKVLNRQLCNAAGNPIQLRGMSSHGLQWFGNCYSQASVQALATQWGADIFRAAMYVDEGGYLSNKTGIQAQVDQLVDWTGQAGMYCIIDWHMLNPGDPNVHLSDAKAFFQIEAQKHAGKKHVIYEICNEPNGVDWNTVKAYAEQVIPIIRQYDTQAIILVGTPGYSGLPGDVRNNPLTGANATNVLYTFHFYAGSHYTQTYLDDVMKTLPIFVSEWGTSNYSGNGGNDYTNSQKWMDLLAGQNTSGQKVSWCNWNFSDKDESSAALKPGSCGSSGWNNTSESGTWVKNHLLSPADSWASNTPPPPGNQPPTVALTSPANNAAFTAPATIALTASASDADGTVSRVEFFNGTTKLGESATAPYTYNWTNVAAGTYMLTARATDNGNANTTSATITIQVSTTTTPPPANQTADVVGPDCVSVNDVKSFSVNAVNLPNATNFQWWCTGSTKSITVQNGQPGRATIDFGPSFSGGQVCVGINYSAAPWYKQFCKNVTVCGPGSSTVVTPPPANQAPTVALTSPANNATFTAPATIALAANANDADGTVTKVEFFSGATKLGESTAAPFGYTWTGVAAGQYMLSAKATDNAGASTTSGSVTINVNAPAPPPPPPSSTTASPTADLLGADCARINDVKSYTLNASKLTNATAFSWWFTGSSQSVTPTTAGQATINFGPYFTGGQVCVGINYSAAPWYQQICKTIAVCSPGARIGSPETTENAVYPNPSRDQFSFTAERTVQALSVVDQAGRTHLRLGTAKAGQTISFGETLPQGVYILRIQYDTQHQRTVKLLKGE